MVRKVYSLTPITCVHIGTGEELTPLDYKIVSVDGDGDKMYWKFSNDRILWKLSDDEQAMAAFELAIANGNMKELQNFFHKNCTGMDDVDYSCEITGNFLKAYKGIRDKDVYANAEKVFQMYHVKEKRQVPAIPGSSLKGSIRTALLNRYLADVSSQGFYQDIKARIRNDKKPGKYEKELQQQLLEQKDRDTKNDPFRAVLIPDCSFKGGGLVGKLENVFFNEQKRNLVPSGITIQAEVIKGELLGGTAACELCIDVDDKLHETPFPSWRNDEPKRSMKAITFEDIHESCNYFYWREFEKEYDRFFKDANDKTMELIVKLKSRLEQAKNAKGQFIIRIGRWSQFEFVTFGENFRKSVVKKDRDSKSPGRNGTRTLFNYDGKYLPMGWCVLSERKG